MSEVPTAIQRLFVAAGWHPGRMERPSPTLPGRHPATAILTNLGGLRVGATGPMVSRFGAPRLRNNAGEECATSDVAFQALPMEDATRNVWAALLQTELIGIRE
jgi:uncharacterized protein (DUF1501 family)